MMRRTLFAASLWIILSQASPVPAQSVCGRVFLDADADGAWDEGESGVAGVAVTDGVQIVRTGADGSYRLDVAADPVLAQGGSATVSICLPSGHWPTTPWFARVEKESGEPAVDFGLRPDEQALPFTFVHGTDCHVPRGGEEKFTGFRRDVESLGAAVRFAILTGDLVDLSDSQTFDQGKMQYDTFTAHVKDFPVPLFFTSGNHDVAGVRASQGWDREHPLYAYGFYTERAGPLRWSFDYAGIHFVGVDFNQLEGDKWSWGVPEVAARWLEADLKPLPPHARIFLFVHFPSGCELFQKVVEKHSVTQIFHGHDHVDRATTFAGKPCLSGGSISQMFGQQDRSCGYRLVRVSDSGMESFYRATGEPHAIALDYPRPRQAVGSENAVRGSFYDPEGKIQKLLIRVGDHVEEAPFLRGPLCARFEAKLELSRIDEGIRPMEVSVTDGRESWKMAGSYLFLTGRRGEYSASAAARLELDVGGVDIGFELGINDARLLHLGPTKLRGDGEFSPPVKGTEVIAFEIPAERLERLNRIELRALPKDGGALDRFAILDARILCGGKTYRDIRIDSGEHHPRIVEKPVTSWIDVDPGR